MRLLNTISEMAANNAWLGLLSRNWQSYADQGVQVAFQLRNAPIAPLNDPSAAAGVLLGIPATSSAQPASSPAGVTLVSDSGAVQPGGNGGTGRSARQIQRGRPMMLPSSKDLAFLLSRTQDRFQFKGRQKA